MRTIRRSVLIPCLACSPLAGGVVQATDIPSPDQVIVQGKRSDLVKAAKEVQLLELLQEHDDARKRYEALYREMNGPKEANVDTPATPKLEDAR